MEKCKCRPDESSIETNGNNDLAKGHCYKCNRPLSLKLVEWYDYATLNHRIESKPRTPNYVSKFPVAFAITGRFSHLSAWSYLMPNIIRKGVDFFRPELTRTYPTKAVFWGEDRTPEPKTADLFSSISDEINYGEPMRVMDEMSQLNRMIVEDCQPGSEGAILRPALNHPPKSDSQTASLADWLQIAPTLARSLNDAISIIDPDGNIREQLIKECRRSPAYLISLLNIAGELPEVISDTTGSVIDEQADADYYFEDDELTESELSEIADQDDPDIWLDIEGNERRDRYSKDADAITYERIGEDEPVILKLPRKEGDRELYTRLMEQLEVIRLDALNTLMSESATKGKLDSLTGSQRQSFWDAAKRRKAQLLELRVVWSIGYMEKATPLERQWYAKASNIKSPAQRRFFWSMYYQAKAGTADIGRPAFVEHIFKRLLTDHIF